MRVSKSVLTTLVGAFVLVTSAGPALARADAGRDAPGDVVSRSPDGNVRPTKPEPARRLGDIIAGSASYGTDLVVTTKFRNLAAIGHQQYSWFILTPADERPWIAVLDVNEGKTKGSFAVFDPDVFVPECGTVALNRSQRTVTLTVLGSCLGDPDWVRVGNGVTFDGGDREYSDDARREGLGHHHWKYSPTLPRA
jgi:hypothetical protein